MMSSDPTSPTGGGGVPPPNNPILTAYENFVRETPFVTRFVLLSQFVTWVLSWFFPNASYAVANIPQFTIFKYEIYRIITSPFICPGLVSLIFAYLSFTDNGRRLELSMGSASFAGMLVTLGCLTNIGHVLVCLVLWGITGSQSYLLLQALGVWIFLFAVIAIDCVNAPANSQRKLFFFTVPTLYYPFALFALFSFFGGFQLSYLISICIGYAYGLGHLDKLTISHGRYQQWEETILQNFTQREGWVASQTAAGFSTAASWVENNDLALSPSSGNNVFDFSRLTGGGGGGGGGRQQDPERGESSSGGGSAVRFGAGNTTSSTTAASFPSSAGRQLGSAEQRRNVQSEREARLKALEQKNNND